MHPYLISVCSHYAMCTTFNLTLFFTDTYFNALNIFPIPIRDNLYHKKYIYKRKVVYILTYIKELLYSTGFGYVWEQQTVNNRYHQFIREFKRRMHDIYVQQCFGEVRDSSRCRLYREIKFTFEMEPYLQNNCNGELRQCLTKIRLSSHKFLVERGRWAKPQISYQE